MPSKYDNINGFFNFEQVYAEQVRAAPQDGAHFLEIGCYLGRSTVFLAECIKESGKNIVLHVIDTFEGEGNSELHGNFENIFRRNLRLAEVEHIVKVHPGTSDALVSEFPDGFFDFVYVDGMHTYEAVTNDIHNYLPKVKPGKTLAGHDYQYEPVSSAVNDSLGKENLTFHQNTWIFQKKQ